MEEGMILNTRETDELLALESIFGEKYGTIPNKQHLHFVKQV